jgi:hypothetical protein
MESLSVAISASPSFWVESLRVAISGRRATLYAHVAHVVGVCAQKEMRRIHAGSVVAVMENHDAIRNRSVRESPRHAMRTFELSTDLDGAISASSRGNPNPALIGLIDFCPEALN